MKTHPVAAELRKLAEELRALDLETERSRAIKIAKVVTAARGLRALQKEIQR